MFFCQAKTFQVTELNRIIPNLLKSHKSGICMLLFTNYPPINAFDVVSCNKIITNNASINSLLQRPSNSVECCVLRPKSCSKYTWTFSILIHYLILLIIYRFFFVFGLLQHPLKRIEDLISLGVGICHQIENVFTCFAIQAQYQTNCPIIPTFILNGYNCWVKRHLYPCLDMQASQ